MLHPLDGSAVGATGVVQVQTPGQLLPGSEGVRVWAAVRTECGPRTWSQPFRSRGLIRPAAG